MGDEKLYTLKEIQIAFSRYFRGGNGIFWFPDFWIGAQGNIEVNWEGFLEQLKRAKLIVSITQNFTLPDSS